MILCLIQNIVLLFYQKLNHATLGNHTDLRNLTYFSHNHLMPNDSVSESLILIMITEMENANGLHFYVVFATCEHAHVDCNLELQYKIVPSACASVAFKMLPTKYFGWINWTFCFILVKFSLKLFGRSDQKLWLIEANEFGQLNKK